MQKRVCVLHFNDESPCETETVLHLKWWIKIGLLIYTEQSVYKLSTLYHFKIQVVDYCLCPFCLKLHLLLPVESSCWLNRPVGTKEMSRLTGLLALQSVLSSDRRSFTYPKSACFQKSSMAASTERALTGQRYGKDRKPGGSFLMHALVYSG